jgi:hypothetical protein
MKLRLIAEMGTTGVGTGGGLMPNTQSPLEAQKQIMDQQKKAEEKRNLLLKPQLTKLDNSMGKIKTGLVHGQEKVTDGATAINRLGGEVGMASTALDDLKTQL